MFERNAVVKTFRSAVKKLDQGDPYALATILQLPPVSPNKRERERRSTKQESLRSKSGTDWSSVLNDWIDANEASFNVRCVGLAEDCQYLAFPVGGVTPFSRNCISFLLTGPSNTVL